MLPDDMVKRAQGITKELDSFFHDLMAEHGTMMALLWFAKYQDYLAQRQMRVLDVIKHLQAHQNPN